jgi:rod shape-determining protein MreD
MNNFYIKYLGLLPVFVLVQVFVLNEILFSTYINPYLYLVLIISLPLKTSKWFLLAYAFTIGFLIDLLGGSLGFHSSATVLIAFIKPAISKITIPYSILEDYDEITLNKIGSKSFIVFSLLIILAHSSILFTLEHLQFNFQILEKIVASSITTLVLVLILEIFKASKK